MQAGHVTCDTDLGWAAVWRNAERGLVGLHGRLIPSAFPSCLPSSRPAPPPRHLAPAGADMDTSYTMAQGLLDGDLSWQIGGEQEGRVSQTAPLGAGNLGDVLHMWDPLPCCPTPLVAAPPQPPLPATRSLCSRLPLATCPAAPWPLCFRRHPGQPQRVVGARQDCGGPPPPVCVLEGERRAGA